MTASSIYDWMKKGYTMVPNVLLHHMGDLGLNSDEFVLILYLFSQLNQSLVNQDIALMGQSLNWPAEKVYEQLNHLLAKGYLSIELVPGKDGKKTDHYSLRPLFEIMDRQYYANDTQKQESPTQSVVSQLIEQESKVGSGELVQRFQKEFGRTLSPMEIEMIQNWVNKDRYSFDLILLALKEAVIYQALNFKYIDTILLNWEKRNIRTLAQAQQEIDRRNQKTATNKEQSINRKQVTPSINIPIYDWNQS
ncbi:DnaD domain-containing protein [Vaginisenegalia massiliensis]|uniref:DnaD domain-containing protein n=1 Tax=Vaginisenegalia massiliensis TaxID=2058294 RepID=UPI000F52A611|nr:DnaD domain protein [Vaginisenegalia massiliensis]